MRDDFPWRNHPYNIWEPPHFKRGQDRVELPVKWAQWPEFKVGVLLVQEKVKHEASGLVVGHTNKWFLAFYHPDSGQFLTEPVLTQTIYTGLPNYTTSYTSPSDWNNFSNTVECLGGGGNGTNGTATGNSGAGGGGGGYTKIFNAYIPNPGTTLWYVRADPWGNDAYWRLNSSPDAFPTAGTGCGARAGNDAVNGNTTGAAGGAAADGYASPSENAIKTSGGKGGDGSTANNTSGGGGGGAGGPNGDGGSPAAGPSAGGNGDAGNGGAGGTSISGQHGGAGNPGTLWGVAPSPDTYYGPGGGGGGAYKARGYGGYCNGEGGTKPMSWGGAGGGGTGTAGYGGTGGTGLIVVTYVPFRKRHFACT